MESSEGAKGVVGGVAKGEMVSLAGSGGRGDKGWSGVLVPEESVRREREDLDVTCMWRYWRNFFLSNSSLRL